MINSVIDISHHNGTALNFKKAKDDGILGVIHKASQGQSNTDPMYKTNREKATDAGLLWGAYHFATGSGGVGQASKFLDSVGDLKGVLLVLDFEPNPTGPSMSIEEAHNFVTYIHDQTKVWPGFYSGHYVKQLLGSTVDPVLSNCWFWLAQYGPTAVVPPTWKTWTMWQYTDGAAGGTPNAVDGIGHCDRDKFNGSEAQLQKLWGVA